MKWASVPSAYRNCIFLDSVRTGRNFSPARKVRSITLPSETRRSLVRTKAPPLPGLTCWKSTILKIVPSTSMWLPFLNWFVDIRANQSFWCRISIWLGPAPRQIDAITIACAMRSQNRLAIRSAGGMWPVLTSRRPPVVVECEVAGLVFALPRLPRDRTTGLVPILPSASLLILLVAPSRRHLTGREPERPGTGHSAADVLPLLLKLAVGIPTPRRSVPLAERPRDLPARSPGFRFGHAPEAIAQAVRVATFVAKGAADRIDNERTRAIRDAHSARRRRAPEPIARRWSRASPAP